MRACMPPLMFPLVLAAVGAFIDLPQPQTVRAERTQAVAIPLGDLARRAAHAALTPRESPRATQTSTPSRRARGRPRSCPSSAFASSSRPRALPSTCPTRARSRRARMVRGFRSMGLAHVPPRQARLLGARVAHRAPAHRAPRAAHAHHPARHRRGGQVVARHRRGARRARVVARAPRRDDREPTRRWPSTCGRAAGSRRSSRASDPRDVGLTARCPSVSFWPHADRNARQDLRPQKALRGAKGASLTSRG